MPFPLPRSWRANYGHACDALRLRAWALDVLASPAAAAPPPDVAGEVWELFLRSEACALPLRARLRRSPLEARPAPAAARVLEGRATIELQRVLSARGQLRVIGSAAGARGWRVAVLKGGAAVAAGLDLDLIDLDLYGAHATARALGEVLDERGYAAAGGPGSHRLAARKTGNALPIELHFAVPGAEPGDEPLARAVPCPGAPGLLRLAPVDQAWHLLQHVVAQHYERRARLRDVLLLGAALAECSAAEAGEAARRAAAHPLADGMQALLALARALRGEAELRDPFRALAAGVYLVRATMQPRPLPPLVMGRLQAAVYARLTGDRGRPAWVDPGFGLGLPSGFRALHWLHARAPRLDRALRTFLRTAPTWALAPAAAALAAAARRAARETAAP